MTRDAGSCMGGLPVPPQRPGMRGEKKAADLEMRFPLRAGGPQKERRETGRSQEVQGMNVKDLMMDRPAEKIASAFVERIGGDAQSGQNREKAVDFTGEFVRKLLRMEHVDTGSVILGISRIHGDEVRLEPCLYRKEDLSGWEAPGELAGLGGIEGLAEEEIRRLAQETRLPDAYGFELSPWEEVLGCEVDPDNAQEVGADALCAGILQEMTFFGFDEETVEKKRQELTDSLREAEEIRKLPKEEQEKYYIPAEEAFAELGLSEPTEEEEAETRREISREVLGNLLRTCRVLRKYMGPGENSACNLR